MKLTPKFYKDRICLNVLGNTIENAKELFDASEGYILVGLLSKNYPSVEKAVEDMLLYAKVIDNCVSVGLGAGDPNQCYMVSSIAKQVQPRHINQVFPYVGNTRAEVGNNQTYINGLVSPCGKIGYVNVATGPRSSKEKEAIVPIESAIEMMKEMGGSSIKYFPMGGLKTRDEYEAVAKACAKHDFGLEPTGGIDLDNFEEIVKIALDAGVKKVIPHVYTSIIDKETGNTKPEDVAVLYAIMQKLVG